MDTLFHFLFTLMALYAARVHVRHHRFAPFLLAFATALPDLDHFFGLAPRATLHNVFITMLLPAALVVVAFEREKYGVFWKQMSILLFLVLASHPLLDFFTSNSVHFFYPVSNEVVNLSGFHVDLPGPDRSYRIVSPDSVGVLIYSFILAGAFFLEELVEIQDRNHRGFWNAMRTLEWKIGRWLKDS